MALEDRAKEGRARRNRARAADLMARPLGRKAGLGQKEAPKVRLGLNKAPKGRHPLRQPQAPSDRVGQTAKIARTGKIKHANREKGEKGGAVRASSRTELQRGKAAIGKAEKDRAAQGWVALVLSAPAASPIGTGCGKVTKIGFWSASLASPRKHGCNG